MKESCCELLVGFALTFLDLSQRFDFLSPGLVIDVRVISTVVKSRYRNLSFTGGEVYLLRAEEAWQTWTHTPTEMRSHWRVLLLRWLICFHACNADIFCNSLRRAECTSSPPLSWNFSLANVDYTSHPKWVFITQSDGHLRPELYVFSGTDRTFIRWSWDQTRLASQTNNLRDAEGRKDRPVFFSILQFVQVQPKNCVHI